MPYKREQLLLIGVILCVGFLGLDRLVVTPLTKLWKARESKIAELQRSVMHGKQLIMNEQKIMARWKEMTEQSQSKDLPATENAVLNAVNKWASSQRLTVTAIKPHWVEEKDCRKLELRVSGTGNLEMIARFLYELEIDPQPLKVEDLEMTARDDKGLALNCELRFTRLVLEDNRK